MDTKTRTSHAPPAAAQPLGAAARTPGAASPRDIAAEVLGPARRSMSSFDPAGWEEAVAVLKRLLDRLPDHAPSHAALAECYALWGFRRELDGAEAESYYGLAYQHASRAFTLAPERADAHRALAVALRRGEHADLDRRQEEALIALDLDSNDAQNWYEYWRAFGYSPQDPAIARALELDPGLTGAHIDLGVVFYTKGRLSDARRHLERAVALAPRNTLALYNLAMTLAALKLFKEAAAALERGLAVEPGNRLLLEGLAILKKGADGAR